MTRTRRVLRLGGAALRLGAVAAAAWRLARAARPRPPVVADPAEPAPCTVTVVVPARDEEHRIGPLLAALAADPTLHEVLVVDDGSTDATAAVAAAAGARVLAAGPLPPGWAGKCWALQQGLDAATGTVVVTLDADTEPAPGLPAALARRLVEEGWALLSAAGRFAVPTATLAVVHPALLTTLVYRFGPAGAAHDPPPHRHLANGQCLAFRRADAEAWGGFAPVAASLVEDVALARHLAGAGRAVALVDATGSLLVRMHADARDAWKGWGRSLPLGEVTSRWWLAADLGVVWLAQALPLLRLLARRADPIDVVALALRAGTLAGTRRAYERPGAAYWLSPLADAAVAARLTQSALRPERTWRGRTYG
ncbi:MAG: glycosyltransferase [Acidimicrobiales bacterium]